MSPGKIVPTRLNSHCRSMWHTKFQAGVGTSLIVRMAVEGMGVYSI